MGGTSLQSLLDNPEWGIAEYARRLTQIIGTLLQVTSEIRNGYFLIPLTFENLALNLGDHGVDQVARVDTFCQVLSGYVQAVRLNQLYDTGVNRYSHQRVCRTSGSETEVRIINPEFRKVAESAAEEVGLQDPDAWTQVFLSSIRTTKDLFLAALLQAAGRPAIRLRPGIYIHETELAAIIPEFVRLVNSYIPLGPAVLWPDGQIGKELRVQALPADPRVLRLHAHHFNSSSCSAEELYVIHPRLWGHLKGVLGDMDAKARLQARLAELVSVMPLQANVLVLLRWVLERKRQGRPLKLDELDPLLKPALDQLKAERTLQVLPDGRIVTLVDEDHVEGELARLGDVARHEAETAIKAWLTTEVRVTLQPSTDSPKALETRHLVGADAYDTLLRLEEGLRECIISALRRITAEWWTRRVPPDVQERAGERRAKQEASFPWHCSPSLDPIFYIDFADYAKIIRRRDNWREAFKSIFKSEEVIAGKLQELEPIRNAIAHSRPIAPADYQRLSLLGRDIEACCAQALP